MILNLVALNMVVYILHASVNITYIGFLNCIDEDGWCDKSQGDMCCEFGWMYRITDKLIHALTNIITVS